MRGDHPKLVRGVLLFAAAVVVAVIAFVGGWHARGDSSASTPTPDGGRAFAPVEGREAAALASRFRPWLKFDSDERWRPLSIAGLLAERAPDGRPLHEFCIRSPEGEDECKPVGDVAQLDGLIAENGAVGSSTYLDIHGNGNADEYIAPDRSAACERSGLYDCGEGPGSAIYYHVVSSNERFYIDYWWFLRFNHFGLTSCSTGSSGICDEHEGDWEGVTLVTAPGSEDRLDYVVYAAHKGTFRYPAQQLEEEDGRPVVYVADGSHASYPQACSAAIVCSQPNKIEGVSLPETSVNGRRSWARNGEACPPGARGSCLLPLPDAEPGQAVWTTWAGLWGETCGKRCNAPHPQSPASPGLQTRFQQPWCSSQEGATTCDSVAPGCNDWLGPQVAVLACNPSAIAAGLRTPEELPSGGLTLSVARAGRKRRVSATTRGVVQALGPPLLPGSTVTISDAGSSTQVLLRARRGDVLLEARFEPFETSAAGRVLKVEVGRGPHGLVLRATRENGARVEPVEQQRARLASP